MALKVAGPCSGETWRKNGRMVVGIKPIIGVKLIIPAVVVGGHVGSGACVVGAGNGVVITGLSVTGNAGSGGGSAGASSHGAIAGMLGNAGKGPGGGGGGATGGGGNTGLGGGRGGGGGGPGVIGGIMGGGAAGGGAAPLLQLQLHPGPSSPALARRMTFLLPRKAQAASPRLARKASASAATQHDVVRIIA